MSAMPGGARLGLRPVQCRTHATRLRCVEASRSAQYRFIVAPHRDHPHEFRSEAGCRRHGLPRPWRIESLYRGKLCIPDERTCKPDAHHSRLSVTARRSLGKKGVAMATNAARRLFLGGLTGAMALPHAPALAAVWRSPESSALRSALHACGGPNLSADLACACLN